MRIYLAKEGINKIILFLILSLTAYIFNFKIISLILFLISLFIISFFRDPDRNPESEKGLVSPADGEVIESEEIYEGDFFGTICRKITIFMRIYDVHINRMPADGKIQKIITKGEKCYPANQRRASALNRSKTYYILLDDGRKMILRQIAGLIARQIVSYKNENDEVKRGEKIGMIQFGSRVELYLENSFTPAVKLGDKVKSGKSILGNFKLK